MLPSKKTHKVISQSTGDNSNAIHAEGDVIFTGLSVADVKEISRDMFKQELVLVQEEAIVVAKKRSEELIDDFASKAEIKFGKLVEQRLAEFKKPDTHLALRQAQQNYCRYGNVETKDVSIDLLLERISDEKSDFQKIIIDKSIEITGSLTSVQIHFLALCHLVLNVNIQINTPKFDDYIGLVSKYWKVGEIDESELDYLSSLGALSFHSQMKEYKTLYGLLLRTNEEITDKSPDIPNLDEPPLDDFKDFWDSTFKYYKITPIGNMIGKALINTEQLLVDMLPALSFTLKIDGAPLSISFDEETLVQSYTLPK